MKTIPVAPFVPLPSGQTVSNCLSGRQFAREQTRAAALVVGSGRHPPSAAGATPSPSRHSSCARQHINTVDPIKEQVVRTGSAEAPAQSQSPESPCRQAARAPPVGQRRGEARQQQTNRQNRKRTTSSTSSIASRGASMLPWLTSPLPVLSSPAPPGVNTLRRPPAHPTRLERLLNGLGHGSKCGEHVDEAAL